MEQLSVSAAVIGRKLHFSETQQRYLVDSVRRWADGPVTVTVKRERAAKSTLQMGYYRGCVLPMIVEEMCGSAEDEECKRTAHLRLKGMFLTPIVVEWVNPETGEEMHRELVPSLADLNTKEMTDFVDRVRHWAGEFFGLSIPEPDKDWKLNKRSIA